MMALSRRNEITILIVLLVLSALIYWYNRSSTPDLIGVFAADQTFQPLNVEDPTLRLDLLERIQKLEYSGTHRNIFNSEPPPPPTPAVDPRKQVSVPVVPTGPPPLDVPATFFGYATFPQMGKREAFFTNGDDVFVVEEGGILLNRFRLIKVNNNTAEIVEVSSGRHATLTLETPPQQ